MRWMLSITACVSFYCSTLLAQPATQPAPADDIWPALERLEDTRLLFHTAMWQVHEARALALEAEPVTPTIDATRKPESTDYVPFQTVYQRYQLPSTLLELDDLTKEGLWLYEVLMSLDEAGQSVCSYRDSGNAPYLKEDLAHLDAQTALAAKRVLTFYETTRATKERFRTAIDPTLTKSHESPGPAWPGESREWGRIAGLSIGWPMLMRPYDDSAQALINSAHGLDNNYILQKAEKVGVGHIFIHDPDAASWRGCEPEPGRYDFSTLDSILTQIQSHHLKAIVFIPSLTSACPAWFTTPDGSERSFVASDGTPRSGAGIFADMRQGRDRFSMFQDKGRDDADESINLHNPAVRAAFEKYLDALGKHLHEKWADTILAVQLETNFTFFVTRTKDGVSTDIDYSRFAKADWNQWLASKYGKADAIDLLKPIVATEGLIARHGTYTPAKLSEESRAYIASLPPQQWQDFLDWRQDYVTRYFQIQADALRKSLPGVPISMDVENFDGHIPLLDRPEFGWNAGQISKQVTDLPESMSSAEWCDNLMRAYAKLRDPASPTWVANQGEKTFGSLITQSITGPYYKDAIILNHRFGPGEVLRYFHDIGTMNYMDQQLNVDGANSWFLTMREDHKIAPEILNTKVATGQVAILWSEANYRSDPETFALREAECWGDAMHCLGYSYEYIFDSHLTAEGLKGYKTLILPASWCLSDAACNAITVFAENGSIVIATSAPGMRDELGQPRKDWPLASLFGVEKPEFIPLEPVVGTPLGIVQPEGWWEMDQIRQAEGDLTYGLKLACTFTASQADSDTFKIRFKYNDNRPAIAWRKAGNGQALLMGYPFGSEYGWSNYNEIGFGKIHGDTTNLRWQRQLEAWLRTQMQSLGLAPVHEAIQSVVMRPNGREIEAPNLGYPDGGSTWENYMYNVDQPDRAIEFTLRDRDEIPGMQYLCVWNREGQYGASRGYVHQFAGPKYLTVKLNIPNVAAIYDVALKSPVKFEKQGNAVIFRTCLSPCTGRMFAISTTASDVTLFEGNRSRGISDEQLLVQVRGVAQASTESKPKKVTIVHQAEIQTFLQTFKGKSIRIGCGSPAYRDVADDLAAALKRDLNCDATVTLAGVQYGAERWRHRFPNYTVQEMPDILIGNEWDNQLLAYFSADPWATGKPQMLFLPMIVNRAAPGPGCGVVELSRPYQVVDRRQRPPTEPAFYRFDPAPQRLVVGGSDVEGARLAVEAFTSLWRPEK